MTKKIKGGGKKILNNRGVQRYKNQLEVKTMQIIAEIAQILF